LVLIAVGAFEVGKRHEGAEDPAQLGDLRNVALTKQDRRLGQRLWLDNITRTARARRSRSSGNLCRCAR
ncbi:MAG: hypothetical protein ACRETX_04300, partial [Steroidobacteraceae bacterium]